MRLTQAETGVSLIEWMEIPLVDMFEWGSVVAKVQKEDMKRMKNQQK